MIEDVLLKLLVFAYAIDGVVTLAGYLPTMRDLWVGKNITANLSSYIIWSACTLVAFLYSIFIVKDTLFRAVSGISFACCAIILVMIIVVRIKNRRKTKSRQGKKKSR